MESLFTEEQIKNYIVKIHNLEIEGLPQKEVLEKTYTLSDVFHERMNRLVLKVKRKEIYHIRTCTVAVAAVIVMLLFSVSNPDAVVKACKSIMQWFEDHVSFQFYEDSQTGEIPQYELQYVPKGYEKVMEQYYGNTGIIVYGKDEKTLSLEYGVGDGNINLNNEGVSLSILKIEKDIEVYYLESITNKASFMTWLSKDRNIVFTLTGETSEEEMIKILKNIRKK